jgi:hypothetical protein
VVDANSDRFAEIFSQVKDSSGRTRAALYVFMVANFALFLTVYGTDLNRRPVERLRDFVTAIVCMKKNLNDNQVPIKDSRLDCRTAKEDRP